MNRWKAGLLAAGLMALSACGGEVLYSNLEEREANEIVALLRAEGLKAKKVSRGGQFRVTTNTQDFVIATDLLNRSGLPNREYQTTDMMFEGGSLVPLPRQQKIREAHAIAQGLEKTLEQIEGVAHASVHVTLPDPPRINQEPGQSTATVVIHHYADVDISGFRTDIRTLVPGAVEGLTLENTSVTFFPRKRLQTNTTLASPTVGTSNGMPPSRLGIGIGLSVIALLIGILAWMLWSGRRIIPSRAIAGPVEQASSSHDKDEDPTTS